MIAVVLVATGLASVAFLLVAIAAMRLIRDRERTLKVTRLSALTERNLNKQGFGMLDEETKSRVALPLRFTPAVGTALIVIGLVLQSPIWLGSMALVAFNGALLPNGMIIDLVYNLGVRHLFRAPPLPSTPKPRAVFLPSFHRPLGRFSHVLLLRAIGVGVYLGRIGRRRRDNPHHYALVSWIMVVQNGFQERNGKIAGSKQKISPTTRLACQPSQVDTSRLT